MSAPGLPTGAEQARTSVACATAGLLTTWPRRSPARPATRAVPVADDGEGRLLLHLDASGPEALALALRPLATLCVRPPGCRTVRLQGAVRRESATHRDGDGDGRLVFRLDVGAVRLGAARPEPVAVEDYLAAEPDPLRGTALQVVAHLRGHGDQLAACLRAHGHPDADWVEPRGLDRAGLRLLVLSPSGVTPVRLAFPRPVRSLAELAPGLRAVLSCQGCCGCDRPGSSGAPRRQRG